MRISFKSLIATAVLGLTGLASTAGAQDARLVSYEELLDRVARLEQEMAETPPAPAAPEAPPVEENYDDGGWYASYENVIVAPYFSQNTSAVIVGPGVNNSIREFNWDMEYSPRFEIGNVDGCTGTGWRARYWHFDHSVNDRGTAVPGSGNITIFPDAATNIGVFTGAGTGNSASATHSLRMSVLDLEMLKRSLSEDGGFTASVGLRYARMDQWLRGRITTPGGVTLANNALHHDFEGIGPTIFGEYLTRFDCSYWGAFVNARGALLYGDTNYRYDVRNGQNVVVANARNVADHDLLAIAEMQIGLDYRRPVGSCSCHELFFRVALEAQYWHNAGSASADMGGFLAGTGDNPQDTDLGFIGVTIATGLDW